MEVSAAAHRHPPTPSPTPACPPLLHTRRQRRIVRRMSSGTRLARQTEAVPVCCMLSHECATHARKLQRHLAAGERRVKRARACLGNIRAVSPGLQICNCASQVSEACAHTGVAEDERCYS